MNRLLSISTAWLAIFCATMPVGAQFDGGAPSSPSISVTGTHLVKRLPETVRAVITLQTKGKTFDEAFANMKAEQQSALEKLQQIGVEKERVTFADFGIDQVQENKRRQMEMMVMQRMRQPNRTKPVVAELVLLKCTVSVDWPLAGKTVEEIFQESHALKQKINTADFTAKKEATTPEEEELAEEMAGMGMHMNFGESSSDGGLRFIYVARISPEDAQQAYKEAFAQAVNQSKVLATAVGVTPGKLMSLSGSTGKKQRNMSRSFSHGEDFHFMQMINEQQFGAEGNEDLECLTMNPDAVEFTFTIHAVFAMEQ